MAFSGSSSHTLDPKGRVTVPVGYRQALGELFTIGLNNERRAIALYPADKWRSIEENLERIPETDLRGMRYVRMINGQSFPGNVLDGQGRVLLPAILREKLGMDKDICFVGVGQYLEVWDARSYDAEIATAEEDSEDLNNYVHELYFRART